MQGAQETVTTCSSDNMDLQKRRRVSCLRDTFGLGSDNLSHGSKDTVEPSQERAKPAVPSLLSQERLGVQVVVLCLGLGLYTSRLDGETGSQFDLARLKAWLNSRWGDRFPQKWEAAVLWEDAVAEPPGWIALAIIAVVIWALWESTKFPRHHSLHSPWDYARMSMQMLGDVALVPFYLFLPAEFTEVLYASTPENERLLACCPSLWRFKQTPWFRNAFLSFCALMWHDLVHTMRGNDANVVHREHLRTPDGGTVALDWFGASKPGANGKTKVLFVTTTWAGDTLVSFPQEVCKHFEANGWQCVSMVKRGCGIAMPNKQTPESGSWVAPWCLGGFDDIQLAIDHVASICPGLSICGIGPSLGAGQLRNYVNKTGFKSKLAAVVVVDAGEDWEIALKSLDHRLPVVAKALAGTAHRACDECGVPAKFESAVPAESASPEGEGDLLRFVRERLAPAHGFEASVAGATQYLRSCQFADPAGCQTPTLEILTFNDLLTSVSMTRNTKMLHVASPHIVTCTTRQGTHIVRWNGIRGRCWISQVGCEFLESALKKPTEKAS